MTGTQRKKSHLETDVNRAQWSIKEALLEDIIRKHARDAHVIYVGFSGGVDSSYLLLKTVVIAGVGKTRAVTLTGPSSSQKDIDESIRFAKNLGVEQISLNSPEFSNPSFRENGPRRCYYCKRSRYEAIRELSADSQMPLIFDGTQADDNPDERPGSVAINELGVVTPLADAGILKCEIREALRCLGFEALSERRSEPCLATRIPFGRPIIEAELAMVEAGERFLRDNGLDVIRLRHHGELARLVTNQAGQRLFLRDESLRSKTLAYLRETGFRNITLDLDVYGSGS